MRRLLSIIVLLTLMTPALAATPSGDKIIAAMKRQFSAVNDYRVEVSLTVKGPKISINNMGMTVYFKKPNKIHVDATQGLAMVPSGNLFGNPLNEIATSAHVTYVRTEKKLGRDCYVLNLAVERMPLLLWVDKERSVIVAMDGAGGFQTTWQYAKVDGKYYLPTQISADMQSPSLAHGRRGRFASDDTPSAGPTKVTVKFSNYKVNKGIDDKIFQEKKRK